MCEHHIFKSKGDNIMSNPIELLEYHTEQILESPITKSIIGVLTVLFFNLFGPFGTPMWYLLVVVVIDLMTGIAKSVKKYKDKNGHTTLGWIKLVWSVICSRGLRDGLWKLIEYLTAIAIANIIAVLVGFEQIRNFVIVYMVLTELRSIHENLGMLGFNVPLASTIIDKARDTILEEREEELNWREEELGWREDNLDDRKDNLNDREQKIEEGDGK